MRNLSASVVASVGEQIPIPLVILDTELRIQMANHSFCETFKIAEEETWNQKFFELASGQWNIPSLRTYVERALLEDNELEQLEINHEFLTIGRRGMLIRSARIESEQDRTLLILLIMIDISQFTQTQEDVRESEERYRSFFAQPLIGMAITSPEKGVLEVNDRLCEMLGYSREEMLDITWPEITHPVDLAMDIEQFDRVMAGEIQGYSIDKRFIRKDGKAIDVIMSSRAIHDRQGQVTYFVALVQDITERKQAQAIIEQRNTELEMLLKLRHQFSHRRNLSELLDMVALSIVTTMPSAETASVRLYDKLGEGFIHRSASQSESAHHKVTASSDSYLAERVYHSNQPVYISDVARELHDEQWWVTDRYAPRSMIGVPLSVDEQPLGVLTAGNGSRVDAFTDNAMIWFETLSVHAAAIIQNTYLFEQLSASHEHTLQLGRQILDAQENERGRVSRELHDVAGQALTALKINLQWITRDLPTEDNGFRETITEAVRFIDETMRQVRALALNLHSPALDALDLNIVLQDYCEDFSGFAHIPIYYVGLEGIPLQTTTKSYLYRTLQEELTNVAKHARAAHVWVRLTNARGLVILSVKDDGQGFDPQLDATVNSQLNHIGLSGMRERIGFLGGWLEIDSRPGWGTRLVAFIPEEKADDPRDARR
jgi:PAS domain S-box-containing protein